MNVNLFKGYVQVVLSGLVIFAATVLVILQWGNHAKFSLYGKNVPQANTAILMLTSAAGGLALWFLAKMMIRGVGTLRRGRRQQDARQTHQRLKELEKKTPTPEK